MPPPKKVHQEAEATAAIIILPNEFTLEEAATCKNKRGVCLKFGQRRAFQLYGIVPKLSCCPTYCAGGEEGEVVNRRRPPAGNSVVVVVVGTAGNTSKVWRSPDNVHTYTWYTSPPQAKILIKHSTVV